jgi:farnesyl diphosphate synthase
MTLSDLLAAFRGYHPHILEIIESHLDPSIDVSLKKHCLDLARYGTAGGKLSRGLFACSTFFELTGITAADPRAEAGFLLGWSIEILQGSYLIADDLMDGSEMRRGQKCWYLFPSVGRFAAFDALVLENFAFFLTDELRHFLPDLVVDRLEDMFRWCNSLSGIGQTFDTLGHTHSFACYDIIVTNKTSYYTIWLPIISGMVVSQQVPEDGIEDAEFNKLLMDLGHYFQVEDDWLDIYGDPRVTGKVGTDLKDGKVTWLSCRSLELCDEIQRKILISSLGQDEIAARSIYGAVNINEEYERYERETRENLESRVISLNDIYPKATMKSLLESFTKRRT